MDGRVVRSSGSGGIGNSTSNKEMAPLSSSSRPATLQQVRSPSSHTPTPATLETHSQLQSQYTNIPAKLLKESSNSVSGSNSVSTSNTTAGQAMSPRVGRGTYLPSALTASGLASGNSAGSIGQQQQQQGQGQGALFSSHHGPMSSPTRSTQRSGTVGGASVTNIPTTGTTTASTSVTRNVAQQRAVGIIPGSTSMSMSSLPLNTTNTILESPRQIMTPRTSRDALQTQIHQQSNIPPSINTHLLSPTSSVSTMQAPSSKRREGGNASQGGILSPTNKGRVAIKASMSVGLGGSMSNLNTGNIGIGNNDRHANIMASLLDSPLNGTNSVSMSYLDIITNDDDLCMLDGSASSNSLLQLISNTEDTNNPESLSHSLSRNINELGLASHTENKFYEWLETDTNVDLQKMKRTARYGIPDQYRAEVWKYLLGVLKPEKTDELGHLRKRMFLYEERLKSVDEGDEVARLARAEVRRRLQQRRLANSVVKYGMNRAQSSATTHNVNYTSAANLPKAPSKDGKVLQGLQRTTSQSGAAPAGSVPAGAASTSATVAARQASASRQGNANLQIDKPDISKQLLDGDSKPPTIDVNSQEASSAANALDSKGTSVIPPNGVASNPNLSAASNDDSAPANALLPGPDAKQHKPSSEPKGSSSMNETRKQQAKPFETLLADPKGQEEYARIHGRVIAGVLNALGPDYDYCVEMVSLLTPFVDIMSEECDVYMSYRCLIEKHEAMFRGDSDKVKGTTASFVTMFRVLQPELWEFFEGEEVRAQQWVPSWLKSLLARQLPLPCVFRLWDTYFSSDDGLELHPFVCLAIIDLIQEELLELDGADVTAYLHSLPLMDMDQVIALAHNIREDVVGRGIL